MAEIVVIVDKGEWDARGDTANAMSVEKALEKAAKSGRIGSLQVDTESLKLKEAGKLSHQKNLVLGFKGTCIKDIWFLGGWGVKNDPKKLDIICLFSLVW